MTIAGANHAKYLAQTLAPTVPIGSGSRVGSNHSIWDLNVHININIQIVPILGSQLCSHEKTPFSE